MEVKLLKSGLYAHPDPSKPQVQFKEGESSEVDAEMCASLLENKWIAKAEEKKEEKVDAPVTTKKKIKKKKK